MTDANEAYDTDCPQPRQLTIGESSGERPVTGVQTPERTHFAHARYAAINNPGVIWYDPRDGIEILNFGVDTSLDSLTLNERVRTGVKLHGHRNRCGVVDPSEKWILQINHAEKVEFELVGDTDETAFHVECYTATEVFESQEAARDAAESRIPEYRDAEWQNAVEYRLEDSE